MRLVSEISRNRICVLIFIRRAGLAAGQTHHGPAHIDVYVTPFYNSKGPVIEVRPFSNGLAAKRIRVCRADQAEI
jgi:hypothetical protein